MTDYVPRTQSERSYYEHLWKIANEEGSETLGGAAAVQFLGRSGVNTGMLRQIWALCTPSAVISKDQFFSVLRLICMFQNGDFPISREQMSKSSTEDFPLPTFSGISMPRPAPAPKAAIPGETAVALPPPAAYAMTSEELMRYNNLFASYDTDHDGYLQGGEAVAVFNQSGLDVQVLRAIWNLADDDKDSKLSTVEFAVAFHLIICVSKKNLPVPPGLPSPLRAFLAAGGNCASDLESTVAKSAGVAPEKTTTASIVTLPRKSISDAFGAISIDNPSENVAAHESGGISSAGIDEVSNAVLDLTAASKKLMGTQNDALEVSERAVSSVRSLIQKLATERVSVSAAAANAEADVQAQAAKLEAALQELNTLKDQCQDLRQRHDEALKNRGSVEQRLSQAAVERQSLLSSIEDIRRSIAQLTAEKDAVQGEISDVSASTAAEREKQNSLFHSIGKAKTETVGLNGEIETLSKILISLNGDKSSQGVELQKLRSKLSEAQRTLSDDKAESEKRASELSIVTDENVRLQAKVAGLLRQLAGVADVSPPSGRAVSCDTIAQGPMEGTSKAVVSSPEKQCSEQDFGNSKAADSEDNDSPELQNGIDDGFGNSAFDESEVFPSTAPDGFGVFGTTEADDGFGNPFASGADGFGGEPTDFSDPFGAPEGLGVSSVNGFQDDGFNNFGDGETMVSTFGDDGFGGTASDGFGDSNDVSSFGDGVHTTVRRGDGTQHVETADGFGDPFGGNVGADAFAAAATDGFDDPSSVPMNGVTPPPMLSERPKHGASTWDVDSSVKGQCDEDTGFGKEFDNSDFASTMQFDKSEAEDRCDDGFGQPGFSNDDGFGKPSASNDHGFGEPSNSNDDGFGQSSAFTDDGFGPSVGDGFGDTEGATSIGSDPFTASGGDLGW